MRASTSFRFLAAAGAGILVSTLIVAAPASASNPSGARSGSDLTVRQGISPLARAPKVGSSSVVPGEVLVRWKSGVSTASRQRVRQSTRTRFLSSIRLARAEKVAVPSGSTVAATVAALEADTRVESAQPNYRYLPQVAPEPFEGLLWGLNNTGQLPEPNYSINGLPDIDINGPEAWAQPSGTGAPTVTVGIIDTGIDISHPDLAGAIWTNPGEIANNLIDDDGNGYVDDVNGWDFLNGNKSVYDGITCADTSDEDFHGTHVAGTIAARRNGLGVVGVAPTVTVMPLKALGCDGGDTASVVEALEYAADQGVDVVNMSLGGSGYDQVFKDAIDAAGLLVVAAAGNGGYDGIGDNNDSVGVDWPSYPAGFTSANVLSVAAVDNRGKLTGFSNYGLTSVDVAAPGASILSDYPGSQLVFLDGTSMATPHVTAVAALVQSANPGFTAAQMKERILTTVRPLASLAGKTSTGGMVDAAAAVSGVASPKLGTSISITRSASTITYGGSVTLSTKLTRFSAPQAGRVVRLQTYVGGSSPWKTVCTLVTSSTGAASCSQKPTRNTTYMWSYAGDPGFAASWSSYPSVAVKARLSSTLSPTRIAKGRSAVFKGTVSPTKKGVSVVLQRWNGKSWGTVTSRATNSSSAYSFTIKGSSRSAYSYRVMFRGDSTNAAGYSTSRRLTVV